jgi:hypothetical protein
VGDASTCSYFAVTADGARYPTLTPARAWTILGQLCMAGDIIDENDLGDPAIPPRRVVARHHANGRWEPMPSPVPAEAD